MSHKRVNKRAELLVGELRPDDGIDPRILFRREPRTRRQTRKDWQLCKHAFRIFSLVLDGLETEEETHGMHLAAVTPAPDATRLRVAVAFTAPCTFDEAVQALQRLRSSSGRLREELAATLSRRRVPELVFGLAGESDGSEGDDGEP